MCIAFAAPARMPGSKRMGTPGSSRHSRLLLRQGEDTGDVSNDRALGGGNGAVAPRGLRRRGRFRHQRGDGEPARCRCRYCPARRAGLLTRRAEGARPIVPYGGRVPVQAVRELPSPIDRTGRALLVGHSDARPGTRPPRRECCARVIHSDGALGQNGHGAWGTYGLALAQVTRGTADGVYLEHVGGCRGDRNRARTRHPEARPGPERRWG